MSEDPKTGFTRRDLVRGTLVGAVASSIGGRVRAAEDPRIGPEASPLELRVNGATHRISVEPRVTLADALRERIGLTGTKVVCGRGACGACTVLLDGMAACSCLTLAHEAAGRDITTIEGLAADGRLAPIQEAFIEADALQCGYCTSGMILSCKVLLDHTPRPSRREIQEAVAGNLCRCGAYPHVFDAVERAAGMKKAGPVALPSADGPDLLAGIQLSDDPRVDAATREALEAEEA